MLHAHYCTTTVPVIDGCTEQWKPYEPDASVEVSSVKLLPCWIIPLSNEPPSAVTVCDTLSLFLNTTLSPFFAVMVDGAKAKPWIDALIVAETLRSTFTLT